jgi:hypothetical protein
MATIGYGRSMERQSNLHSPRVDDELEHETSSLTRGAPVEARADESRLMEDAGDGEPVSQSIVGELQDAEGGDEIAAGLSRGEVIARSELAIHLRPSIFPAGRDAILECAEEENAPTDLLGQLRGIPHRSYANVQEVWEALGGKREEGSGHVVQDDPHVREDGDAPQKTDDPMDDPLEAASPEELAEVHALEFAHTADSEELAQRAELMDSTNSAELAESTEVIAPETAAEPAVGAGASPQESASPQRFPFRFDLSHRLAALPFRVVPSSAYVEVSTNEGGERMLTARFGPWCVQTPVDNVAGTETSGPYSLLKTAGPAHVSLKDFGLTFASNGQRGLCIRFRRSVHGVEPTGVLRHPALTVTVDDVEGLEHALTS